MKNKIKLIIMLFVFACMSLSVGFACSKSSGPIAITGFDEDVIVKEITVNAGDNVSIQSPLVIDENNNVLDVHVSVTDANGGFVEVKANKFFALDGAGYTIKYLVQTYDGNITIRTTKVNVIGNYYLTADMQQVYFINEVVTLNATHRLDDPIISYEVIDTKGEKVVLGGTYKASEDSEEITLNDNQFVATQSGFYDVIITAKEGDNPSALKTYDYTTQIYVYEYESTYKYGAVEVFDENWEVIRKLSGYGMQNWSLTNTAQTGILGPKGTFDWFLTAKTTASWNSGAGLDFWLNPLFDKENYLALVDQGFTKIVIPVMQVGGTSAGTFHWYTTGHVQNDTSYMYNLQIGGGINAGDWILEEINLIDSDKDWNRSFTSCYDLYADQITQFIKIKNGGGNCTYYLGSIYALKDVVLEKDDSAKDFSVEVGHTIEDLGAYVKRALMEEPTDENPNPPTYDLEYRILFRGKETVIKGATTENTKTPYTLSANGEYTISVVPARKDLNIKKEQRINFKVTVSDEVSISYSANSDLEYPRSPVGTTTISFKDLGIILKDGKDNVIPAEDISYEVYFNGSQIDAGENDFIADKDGKYTVVAVGKYGQNKELVAYKDSIVNVFSTANIGAIDKDEVSSVNIADSINSIMEYTPARQFVSYKVFKVIGPNMIELANAPISSDGKLTITSLPSGYYKVYATDVNNADEVADIDVWSSKEGRQFSVVREDILDYVVGYKIYSWGIKDYSETKNITVSEDGNYFVTTFDSRGNSLDNAVRVYPLHSLSYYEQFKGMDGVIYFDYYYEAEQYMTSYRPIGTPTNYRPDIKAGISNKMTLSVSLDELLEYWSSYNSTKIDDAYTFLIKEHGWVWSGATDNLGEIKMYVGNFRFNYVEKASVTDEKINLIDVKDVDSFDLSTIISEQGKAIIKDGYSYVLSCKAFDVKLGASSIADVSKTENQRLFELKVYDTNGFLQYKGYVDFYDSSATPVWNSVDAKYFQIYSGASKPILTEFTTEKVAKNGQQVDAVKITKSQMQSSTYYVMNPIHSKGYYELMDELGYSLNYSVYFDAPSGSAPLNQFLGLGAQIGTETQLNVDSGWWDLKVSLSDLVAKWSNYVEVKGSNGDIAWGDRNKNGLFYTYNPKADVTMYVTGFAFTKA